MTLAESAEIIELTGLTFDGMGAPLDAVVPALLCVTDTAHVAIDNCVVTGSILAGIAVERSAGRISRTTVRGAGGAGIQITEAREMAVIDNRIENCGNGGIHVHRWTAGDDGTIVSGNRISGIAANDGGGGYNGNGISLFRADGVAILNNRIEACAAAGIRVNSSSNVRIAGNECRRLGEAGILMEFAFAGAAVSGNVIDGAPIGIAAVNFDAGGRLSAISGNMVRNISAVDAAGARTRVGSGIVVEADASVTGNVIEGAARRGMSIGWGPSLRDVVATGNVVRGAPVGIGVSVVAGAGTALIADNLISGAESGAVVGMHWDEPVTGDLADPGAPSQAHLLIERNRVS